MKVIFLEDVANQANAGDIKVVANGYARNFLIPKKLATMATREEMKRVEGIKRAGDQRRIRESKDLETVASAIDGAVITVRSRVTPAGHFYGAISPAQIAQELADVTGAEIDRKLMDRVEPIKDPGEYEVVLLLAPGVQATILVTAEAQE